MQNSNITSISLISSAVSLVLLTTAAGYSAGLENQAALIKCAGVVKAGLNDCASAEHACAGLNTEDGYDSDWLWLPKGTCDKITSAHIINNNS